MQARGLEQPWEKEDQAAGGVGEPGGSEGAPCPSDPSTRSALGLPRDVTAGKAPLSPSFWLIPALSPLRLAPGNKCCSKAPESPGTVRVSCRGS